MASKKKKVVSKDELRRLMKKTEAEVKNTTRKKVVHPLAAYNSLGQLVCSLCNSLIKSDLLWTAHIQSKAHKERFLAFKSKPAGPARPDESLLKRKSIDDNGILKRAKGGSSGKSASTSSIPADFFDKPVSNSHASSVPVKSVIGLAAYSSSEDDSDDEDDRKPTATSRNTDPSLPPEEDKVLPKTMSESLPEGFFDDPKMDAKVRQVEYRDKLEDEWERFQKAMKEESTVSEAIMEEEDEQATVDRNIDEIDEQIQKWKEVNELHDQKEELMHKKADPGGGGTEEGEGEGEEGDELEYDEFLDWRTKQVWK